MAAFVLLPCTESVPFKRPAVSSSVMRTVSPPLSPQGSDFTQTWMESVLLGCESGKLWSLSAGCC